MQNNNVIKQSNTNHVKFAILYHDMLLDTFGEAELKGLSKFFKVEPFLIEGSYQARILKNFSYYFYCKGLQDGQRKS